MDVSVICTWTVYFSIVFDVVLLMNSLGKSVSEKCIVLLCNYYCFGHKRGPKEEKKFFYFFVLHPILMHFVLQNDYLN